VVVGDDSGSVHGFEISKGVAKVRSIGCCAVDTLACKRAWASRLHV